MRVVVVVFLITGISGLTSCESTKASDSEALKAEVRAVEEAFDRTAQEKGVAAAFIEFAADSAVINRGGKIIKGKKAISDYFKASVYQEVKLTWSPEFIEVSTGGDLAYTYGDFQFSALDSAGQAIESSGKFHTVWKRQTDGSWKFVYD